MMIPKDGVGGGGNRRGFQLHFRPSPVYLYNLDLMICSNSLEWLSVTKLYSSNRVLYIIACHILGTCNSFWSFEKDCMGLWQNSLS